MAYTNYMKVGNLLIRKIFKINATICHILKLKCTKFDLEGKGREEEGREGRVNGPRPRF